MSRDIIEAADGKSFAVHVEDSGSRPKVITRAPVSMDKAVLDRMWSDAASLAANSAVACRLLTWVTRRFTAPPSVKDKKYYSGR
jgi:hypothetical protein